MASLTSVKVKHGKIIRRFTADHIETLFPDLESLRLKIFGLFFFPFGTDFTLKYIDRDGDEVSLFDGDDLRELFRQNLTNLTILVDSKTDPRTSTYTGCSLAGSDEEGLEFEYSRSHTLSACVNRINLELSNALLLVRESIIAEIKDDGVFSENDYGDDLKESNCLQQGYDGDGDGDHDDNDMDLSVCPLDDFSTEKLEGKEKDGQENQSTMIEGGDVLEKEAEGIFDQSSSDLEVDAYLETCKANNSDLKLKMLQHEPLLEENLHNSNDTGSNFINKFGFKISLSTKDTFVSDTENDDDIDPVEFNGSDDLVDIYESESSFVNDVGDFGEKGDFNDEEAAITKLSEMGFAENDFCKEVLKVHRYNIEDSMDDLCGNSEWDLMLEELQEMEFTKK